MCSVPKPQDLDIRPSFSDYWKAAMKYCPLDPAPTSVVLQVLDVLLPLITCMINSLFECGMFAEEWILQALILPTLKKCGLDIVCTTCCS